MNRLKFMAEMASKTAHKQQGMSLIEVMIAVLVLAVGLLGVAAMQALSLRASQGSLESNQAVMATNSIAEAMRANRANAAAYIYNGLASCGTIPGAGATLAKNDLNNWVTQLKTTIGNSVSDTTTCGKIEAIASGYRVTVQWDDSRAEKGNSTHQIATDVSI